MSPKRDVKSAIYSISTVVIDPSLLLRWEDMSYIQLRQTRSLCLLCFMFGNLLIPALLVPVIVIE